MHGHGPTISPSSWLIATGRTAAEDRRLSHLVALAESRVGRRSWLDRVRSGISDAIGSRTPAPALDCCAVA